MVNKNISFLFVHLIESKIRRKKYVLNDISILKIKYNKTNKRSKYILFIIIKKTILDYF